VSTPSWTTLPDWRKWLIRNRFRFDGPILRNRKHVLRKGFEKDTPAKKQFVPAWNWLHEREDDLKAMMKKWNGQITVYGCFLEGQTGY
jgi:hypothetical protein